MRVRLVPVAMLALLGACNQEPSFEERYSEAEATVSQQAQSIESDLEEAGEAAPGTSP